MAQRFEGRVAFVAGGSGGINLGIARALALEGSRIHLVSRNAERLEIAAGALAAEGASASWTAADVRDFAAIDAAFSDATRAQGPVDLVVSGAAGNFVSPAAGISANGFRTVVDIDLVGTFHVFRAAYDHVRRPSAMLAITAPQALVPLAGQAHVCAAKAGINMLVRVLALEWGCENIRLNGLSPGPIDGTEGVERMAPSSEAKRGWAEGIALERFGTMDEITKAALYLLGDDSSYVTGTVLDCDGGFQLGRAGGEFAS